MAFSKALGRLEWWRRSGRLSRSDAGGKGLYLDEEETAIMALGDFFRKEARRILATVQQESNQVEADLAKAQELVGLLKTKITVNNAIQRRLLIYYPERQHEPDCPQCWMMEGEHVSLQPVSAPKGEPAPDTTHFWGCSNCGSVYGYDESPVGAG
jgi:hypothetical protein